MDAWTIQAHSHKRIVPKDPVVIVNSCQKNLRKTHSDREDLLDLRFNNY